ncbi:MAG: alkaline phosphatase [Saprospiraceae bacterium]
MPSNPFRVRNMQQWAKNASVPAFIFLLLCISSCSTSHSSGKTNTVQNETTGAKPKNVIFLIGDGMGLPQITGAMYMNDNKTVFERFKNIGFHKSYSADNLVTDSAAGATAFASGVKTDNGYLGMDAHKKSFPTILEMAEKKGMATGLVVTCSMTHATPAAYYAHIDGRTDKEAIALQMLNSNVDLFIGGGEDSFIHRADGRDLVKEFIDKGYVINDIAHMRIEDLDTGTKKNIGFFTSDDEPLPVTEGRNYAVPATDKALGFLDTRSPSGFFMMIEGSQIDWGGHANDANYVVTELHEFEKVIAEALDFAEKDGNTLVIVTADHETGGFAVNPGSKLNHIEVAFTTKEHTAMMIPVFASGPGAELFRGIYENTDIFWKLKSLMGVE